MQLLRKYSPAIIVLAILGATIYFIYDQFRMASETADQSCMASVMEATNKAWKAGTIKLEENESSRDLTIEEIKLVISQNGDGDCASRQGVLDQMHIAIGDVNKVSHFKIRVWTNGRDGISGTRDDLVIPWEENSNH